ncbi:MAG: hypothetical protein IPJ18_19925 [Betaproteobacteria bacterium]|nr:hypothetical protein [Betaproteobacteria bacterium]
MEISGLERERKFLRSVGVRWELRGWYFTPLDGLDGENAVIDSLWMLGDSPLVWLEFERYEDANVTSILEDLETVYRRALQYWEKFKTVFDAKNTMRDRLRWPYGTYPRRIQQEARFRYRELKTTSRFSVDEAPDIFELQRLSVIADPLTTLGHVASLVAMVLRG